MYCQQRPCQLYRSDVTRLLERLAADTTTTTAADRENNDDDANPPPPPYESLTPTHRLSHSPRFTADGQKLVFLTSQKGFETHAGCMALAVIVRKQKEEEEQSNEPEIVVDAVWDPAASSSPNKEAGTVAGLGFPGLFMGMLPVSCLLSSDYLLATTQWGSCQKVVRISLTDGSIRWIQCGDGGDDSGEVYSSDELLCVTPNGDAIVAVKTPSQPASIRFIPCSELLQQQNHQAGKVETKLLAKPAPIAASKVSPVTPRTTQVADLTFDVRVIDAPSVTGVDFRGPLQSILLLPNKTKHPNPPLIVVPHGGPHGSSSTIYLPSYAFLCSFGGYAILLVNYRGSTGQGQGSIEALPTNIGRLDVQDVVAATQEVKDSGLVDASKIGICGGSHGGFLTAHVTSQYPDLFRAAVMRNPVVNLASMVTSTDIPDWAYVEALGSYHWNEYRPPTKAELEAFYSKSPIQYIQSVKAPTLVALGMKDLRVPPSQGLEWFHTLRSMKIQTKLQTYQNDDHAIDGVASEADHWINIKQWFDQHLR